MCQKPGFVAFDGNGDAVGGHEVRLVVRGVAPTNWDVLPNKTVLEAQLNGNNAVIVSGIPIAADGKRIYYVIRDDHDQENGLTIVVTLIFDEHCSGIECWLAMPTSETGVEYRFLSQSEACTKRLQVKLQGVEFMRNFNLSGSELAQAEWLIEQLIAWGVGDVLDLIPKCY
jgi:hypothetical protein